MIDDMVARKLGVTAAQPHRQLQAVRRFLKRSPETATADDMCAFQKR